MSIIEQIKVEIERLKSNMDDRDPLAPNQKAGYLFALADVLSFISTLESENPVPNDLEEAVKKCVTSIICEHGLYDGDFIIPVCEDFFKAGAEWNREQMLKDAVECELVCIKNHLAAILPMKEFQWTVGDKVSIIIVKKDTSHNNC